MAVVAGASSLESAAASTGEPVTASIPASGFPELLSCFFSLGLPPPWEETWHPCSELRETGVCVWARPSGCRDELHPSPVPVS